MNETLLPSVIEVKAELCRRSLSAFVKEFWSVLEPTTPLVWNWHMEVICEHLSAVTLGASQRLAIAIPPGHCKSILVCCMWPAWEWASDPSLRSIFASYASDLAVRDSVRCRAIIESDKYRAFFPSVNLSTDQNVKSYFKNDLGGERLSLGTGGKATGFRAGKIVCDDAMNATDATSEVTRNNVIEWWDKAMSSRLNDMRKGARVLIGQRLHEDDLVGHVLRQGGYDYLCLPSECDGKRRAVTFGGAWVDPRKEGELLFPEMFPAVVLERARLDLGSDGYAAQHDQLPLPASGGMFKRNWWRRYAVAPVTFDEWIGSIDCTFKDSLNADFVALQIWARAGANRYLIKSYHARLSFVGTCQLLERAAKEFPEVSSWLVEDKANGPAVISALRNKVVGIIPIDPGTRAKEARAAACTPFVEAGNVWIPENPSGAVTIHRQGHQISTGGWEDTQAGQPVDGFLNELAAFPRGRNDDHVDALSQVLNRWHSISATQAAPIVAHLGGMGRSIHM